MNFLHCLLILLIPIISSYSNSQSNGLQKFLHLYMKQRERSLDETNRKFGSPRQHLFRPSPIYYQEPLLQNPPCLPHVWTCGPHLPPCCPGLMCYDGNAKRGRFCVAKG